MSLHVVSVTGRYVDLPGNQLSGSIPSSLESLVNLLCVTSSLGLQPAAGIVLLPFAQPATQHATCDLPVCGHGAGAPPFAWQS